MFLSSFDNQKPCRLRVCGAPIGHDARIIAEAARACAADGGAALHVALDDIGAALMADALAFFAPEIQVLPFPAWDCLPYDRVSPHADIAGQRLATLSQLLAPLSGPVAILTTVNAFMQRTLPAKALRETSVSLTVGAVMSIDALSRALTTQGYRRASTVREVGEYAVRGGIVDLFPAGSDHPLRLDFFGEDIEGIRRFDPLTQLSGERVDTLTLRPTSEVFLDERSIMTFRTGYRELFGSVAGEDPLYEAVSAGRPFPGVEHWLPLFHTQLSSLLDYAPHGPVFFAPQVTAALRARAEQIADFYEARKALFEAACQERSGKKKHGATTLSSNAAAVAYKPVPATRLYLSPEEIDAALEERAVGLLSVFRKAEKADEGKEDDESALLPTLDAGGQRGRDFAQERALQKDAGDLYTALAQEAARHQAAGKRVIIACYSQGSADRIAGLLRAHGVKETAFAQDWGEARGKDPRLIILTVLGLEHGFVASDLVVMTEQDILGDRLTRPTRKKKASAHFRLEIGNLEVGDFVVHADHGVGRYEGLETIEALGTAHDCVRLIYDGGDKLFVPVENMDALSRYASADAGAPLDKLGGAAWQARKARVKKRLLDMAGSLLEIAAARQLRSAERLEAPEAAAQEFAARFPYNETEDQEQAIAAVLEDLASGKPMDRLVCGDVGFGKTEVALRAAFAATNAGCQVAVIVPTTFLARQHFQNFTRRFKGFPVRIAQLSRMVGAKEAKETKAQLARGEVDIVIGTHALLGGEIAFTRLGLVIIDEEQHFGVKQKEKLKSLRADVHVLTLTATPIPRTLQLALTGVRELSLIATPPTDRLAVSTAVLPYDPVVIREALRREHYRGGQSFYVCPRIEDLTAVSAQLRELVPDLKVVMAHGRMGADELDEIMTAFDGGAFDILLATNIVESGLDIPNANTIVLHRADLFGLAQLYQLRGRIGRGKQRGHAYFTYAPDAALSGAAQQRLEVIATLDQLGAGFQLASHDMDIRGAGNVLGQEQSGHIREVGIELYQQMLEDAVATAKAAAQGEATGQAEGLEAGAARWTPQINIGLSVLIPETYVSDLNVRLGLYRRLAEEDGQDEEAIAAEMVDRFGPLPPEVENLLQIVAIKHLCRKAGIAKLDAGAKGAVIGFYQDRFARPDRLVTWIGQQTGTVRVRPDQKLSVLRAWDNASLRLEGVKKILEELIAIGRSTA